jgi:hypothetical protein
MLLKRFSFDVEHFPGKNNEMPDALSRQPGDEVFVEDPAEAEAFLTPERIDPEGPEFLAFLNTAELHRRIVEAQDMPDRAKLDLAMLYYTLPSPDCDPRKLFKKASKTMQEASTSDMQDVI